MSYFRQQLENWLKTIDVKADRVLDVGGGALPVPKRVKSWDVKEYKILDNELEDMKQKPDIVMDLNESVALSAGMIKVKESDIEEELKVDRFDVVFCLEVFEYIWRPFRALENINIAMKPQGILYISFPFIYPMHNPIEHDYLRYTRFGVCKLLEETGFEIEYVKARVMTDGGVFYWKDFLGYEGMHPSKNFSGHNEVGYVCKCIKK